MTHSTPINALHFLVHPMYLGDTAYYEGLSEQEQTRYSVQARLLSLRYEERIRHLPPDAAAVVFSHLPSDALQNRPDPYVRYLQGFYGRLKDALGDRYLFVPGGTDIFDDFAPLGRIWGDLRRRGFALSRSPLSYAYGETMLQCVLRAAANANEGFDLEMPTTIELGLTDALFWWESTDSLGRAYVQRELKKIHLRLEDTLPADLQKLQRVGS